MVKQASTPKQQGKKIVRTLMRRRRYLVRLAAYRKLDANRLIVNGDGPWFVRTCNELLASKHRAPKFEASGRLTLRFRAQEMGGDPREFVLNSYRIARGSGGRQIWVSANEASFDIVRRGGNFYFVRLHARNSSLESGRRPNTGSKSGISALGASRLN